MAKFYSALAITFLLSIISINQALAIDLHVKDYGAKGDGIANDTAAIQKAINAVPLNGRLYFPAGKYMVDAKISLKLKSNMKLWLHSDATLAVIPNNVERSYLLSIVGVTNVEVYGGRLLGDRDQHKGTTGEWGYGIHVARKDINGVVAKNPSSKIIIRDMHISNFWGDGIQVGGQSKDIQILRVISTKNRRQGLSITQAENVKVIDSEFSHTQGTAPEYGIDIEPDPVNNYYAKNIVIQGCRFHNNRGGGLMAYKSTSDIVIRWNIFEYNNYGIYTVGSVGGAIYGNEFLHNNYHGVALRGTTSGYLVENNIFRNNSVKAAGITEPTPLKSITGVSSGSTGTAPHLNLGPDLINVDIMTNRYSR